jgi:serine/threonine-protein kinase
VRNLVYSCIAKNPADRPQTAAHLARAATALRRGDVQGAAAAVPAVLGAGAATAATMLMPQQGATAATTVLPAGGAIVETEEEAVEEKKRSPWTWPLIVLIAILAIVLIGTIIALALNSGGDKPAASTTKPPASSTAAPPSSSTPPPPPTSEAPETVQIDRAAYIGMNVDDARAAIEALGLPVSTQEGAAATTPDQANTVSDVNPSGPVAPGTTITLTYLAEPVSPDAPGAAPTVNPAVAPAGSLVNVSWPAASCPAGQTLSGYEVAVTGDATPPSPVGANTTNVNVQAGTQSFEVTYRYFCGQLDSPFSPAAPVTIAP